MIPYAETIPTRWGNIIALRCDPYQYNALTLYGEWAHDEMEICLGMIKEGDVVLDIGANIGSTMLPFALRVGRAGTVLAFEPQWLPFLCMCGTAVMNGVAEWARPANLAVGDKPGTLSVPNINPTKPNNVGGVRIDDDRWEKYLTTSGPKSEVRVITVDGLSLDRVDFIKIDVEGMESKVLAGAEDTVRKCRPIIWAEALPHIPENRAAIKRFLDANDYNSWQCVTPVFSPDNARMCSANLFGPQSDINVLAVPKETEPPQVAGELVEFKP